MFMSGRLQRVGSIAFVVLTLVAAGCGDSTASSTTAPSGAGGVELGQGVMPSTVPGDFPVPQRSSVGSTMVVADSGLTEIVMRIGTAPEIAALFFEQNLPARGFTVARSETDGSRWTIEFSDESLTGTIEISQAKKDVAQAVIRLNAR